MKRRSLGNDRWSEILRGGENSFEGIGREKLRMENRTSISLSFFGILENAFEGEILSRLFFFTFELIS